MHESAINYPEMWSSPRLPDYPFLFNFAVDAVLGGVLHINNADDFMSIDNFSIDLDYVDNIAIIDDSTNPFNLTASAAMTGARFLDATREIATLSSTGSTWGTFAKDTQWTIVFPVQENETSYVWSDGGRKHKTVRLGPKDGSIKWLDKLVAMARNRVQWKRCNGFLSPLLIELVSVHYSSRFKPEYAGHLAYL